MFVELEKVAPIMFLSSFFFAIDLLLLGYYYYCRCCCCSVAVVMRMQNIFNRKNHDVE